MPQRARLATAARAAATAALLSRPRRVVRPLTLTLTLTFTPTLALALALTLTLTLTPTLTPTLTLTRYGRGPHENYADRCTGAPVATHRLGVDP